MEFFYSASVMGYGKGRFWHRFPYRINFPNFPRVTKTLTYKPNMGYPFLVVKTRKSVFNHVSLHNIGYRAWIERYLKNFDPEWSRENIIISLAGTDYELETMIHQLDEISNKHPFKAFELNFSCPNHISFGNKDVPYSIHPIYLKLNYKMCPMNYDLSSVEGIRLNSVPMWFGGGSGKYAQEKNWNFIQKFGKILNIAGCSITNIHDIDKLRKMGCTEIGLGSIVLTNPSFVKNLRN